MASKGETGDILSIDEAVAALGADAPDAVRGPLEDFLRGYFGQVTDEALELRGPAALQAGAASLWELGTARRPGTAAVRVIGPSEASGELALLEVVNDDMPFLVDSLTAFVAGAGLEARSILHPVLPVARDAEGRRIDDGAAEKESYIQIAFDGFGDAEALEGLARETAEVLEGVRAAVEDWRPMRARLTELRDELEARGGDDPMLGDALGFLRWLDQDHFTFLGYRRYTLRRDDRELCLDPVDGSELGILREGLARRPDEPCRVTAVGLEGAERVGPLLITKSGSRSWVHRSVLMDHIGIMELDADGLVVAEHRFIGLFTSLAYSRRAGNVPLLAGKVARVLDLAGFDPKGHDGKALLHILETFPRDELFRMPEEELLETALVILRLPEHSRLALFVRPDPFGRFVSCLVYVPKDQYNTRLRKTMEGMLEEAFAGTLATRYTWVDDEAHARVYFIVTTDPDHQSEVDVELLESHLAKAALTWPEVLEQALIDSLGGVEGRSLERRYREAFSAPYRAAFQASEAVEDIPLVEASLATGEARLRLHRKAGDPESSVRFRIVHSGDPVPLSKIVPLYEHLGFRVVAERPYEVRPEGAAELVWVREFQLETEGGEAVDLEECRGRLQETFAGMWTGEVEADHFSRLVLRGCLTWREIAVLRAYSRYLRQLAFAFSKTYMAETLVRNPDLARFLVELFQARFDPDLEGDREALCTARLAALQAALDQVQNLDEDRILRRFLNLVQATVRTNYYQVASDGRPKAYLSFKLDGARVSELPEPRPTYEIFVSSPRVEGVHLRGGKVARGGLRWSDRLQDYRTEILGLVKAQMVKNAVIVPVGAKGGFVLKRPPADPAAIRAEGESCYKIFIRGLLDLTDNLVGGQVAPPPRVVRLDDDDPYLVVAADKGTATFSDLANGIAAEYGFWLGDAFASGGSRGYDHKKMAITARGAWEAVKRHFRELDKDIQQETFTAVGVGDMSGDVFGNGMLLSTQTRLVAAFNHRHIFLDPDPDPAVSFAERKRLFEMPRSSWADYDLEKVSAGGGVFDRGAKSVPLSEPARRLLELEGQSADPSEVIRAILRCQVELLWFGGIGTFVKAAGESQDAAGDRANDPFRVDARELRCAVIGEGANLGLTQRGRIEYALRGGRINTDAIDNSGGVGCSDREVNIKVLLDRAVAAGDLASDDRDALLEAMTDEVAALVLRDNYLQTQALTVTQARGLSVLDEQSRFMRDLERAGDLDRSLEMLPEEEDLAGRVGRGHGLTRPELAVLLAYSKITLFEQILQSDLPDDPYFSGDLESYFPEPLRSRFAAGIQGHRLRREIIATHLGNSLVNRVGPTFFNQMTRATGREASDVARAYSVVREVFGLRELWREIEALDNQVSAKVQVEMFLETARLAERATPWLLRQGELQIQAAVERYSPGVQELTARLGDLLHGQDRNALDRRRGRLEKNGVPSELAATVARLGGLHSSLEIVRIAAELDRPAEDAARAYFAVGYRFNFDWLRGGAHRLSKTDTWQRQAARVLLDDLFVAQGDLTIRAFRDHADAAPRTVLKAYAAARPDLVRRTQDLISEMKATRGLEISMLAVAAHQLRSLAAS